MKRSRALNALVLAATLVGDLPAQTPPAPFDQQQLTSSYYTEGANVGDCNRDGHLDIIAGPFWWQGPDFTAQHTIYAGTAFPVGFYSDNFCSFVHDMNGDGWIDVLVIGFPGQPAVWYENPQAAPGMWQQHLLHPSVATESPTFTQLIGDAEPELVCGSGNQLGYLTHDPAAAGNVWSFHAIATTPGPLTFAHGLGVGDIDDDGRLDVLTGDGWYQQPASLVGNPPWPLHPWSFGTVAGAQMFAYDVDGDGDRDLITSIDAHGYGLSWFEHTVVGGARQFVEHVILPPTGGTVSFSQLHALTLRDVNGDGLLDIVTGKTFWAHLGADPGALDPAVLYWFELQRDANGVNYVPHLIHDDSGVGRQVVSQDLNDDGHPDVVVGSKKGISVFRRRSFWSNTDAISLTTGGTQRLYLHAPKQAGLPYVILGSLSGTIPGTFAGAVHIPLNFDGYTSLLQSGTAPFVARFAGLLDEHGLAAAQLSLPPGLPLPPLIIDHAFVALDSQGTIVAASNAVSLSIF